MKIDLNPYPGRDKEPLNAHPQDGLEEYQRAWEIETLEDLYIAKAPKRVCEIGIFQGGTLKRWLQHAAFGAIVVAVDIDLVPLRKHPYSEWVKPSTTLKIIQGGTEHASTFDAVREAVGGQLDWLWIDGDHTYNMTKSDLARYGPLVVEGGLIAMHDINLPGIAAVWDEVQKAGYLTRELQSQFVAPDEGVAKGTGIGVIYV